VKALLFIYLFTFGARVESCLVSNLTDGALTMALSTRGLTSFLKYL
jgi:hypothetical protein